MCERVDVCAGLCVCDCAGVFSMHACGCVRMCVRMCVCRGASVASLTGFPIKLNHGLDQC